METLISRQDIASRVRALGEEIARDYRGKDLVVVGVLKGCFIFISDLIRELPIPHELDFIAVSSYGDATRSSGAVRLLKDLETDIAGRDVLLVEDIVDTGHTLAFIRESFALKGARSVATCTLLDKAERRERDVPIEYVGFEIPDHFVIGYGMDFAERYREMGYIGVLDEEEALS